MQLVHGGLEDAMTSGLEVTTRNDLKGVANVNDKRTRLVGDVVPLLIPAPDLETGDGHREQKCSQPKVCVAVHAKALGCLLCLLLDGSEEGVAEVALACWAPMRLYVVPEIIVGQLKNSGEKSQETFVHGVCEVVAERFDFVHEWVKTVWYSVVGVLPIGRVPVELFNAVGWSTSSLEYRISIVQELMAGILP